MDGQDAVASFIREHDLEAPPVYRLVDLVSEVGEVAKDSSESTEYGEVPDAIDLSADELGDVLFAMFALCECVGVDADQALNATLRKYEDRLAELGTAGSGE